MSGGSVRDLVRKLNDTLSQPAPPNPLPEDVLNVIQSYLNRHVDIDGHESQRLHEELLTLHAAKVHGHPDRLAVFLACFRQLRPAIYGVERLLKWWEILVRPTLDSMGQTKAVVADARAIVLSVLAYEEDDDPTGQKAQASAVFTDKLFEIYMERASKPLGSEKSAGFKQEQRHRLVSANVEAVLLAYGKRKPKAFLQKIDAYVVQKESRLQVLGLLCSYVRLQGPHLYQVLQTQLFDHLLLCLERDMSSTVISLAMTILIMFMPHLCNSLGEYLPRLFVIYGRLLCWDKFGSARLEVSSLDNYSRSASPLSAHSQAEGGTASPNGVGNGVWQRLDSSFETSSATPDVSDYFTFLYGLYPINFISFIREPYKYLEQRMYRGIDSLDIEEDTIRQRTEAYRQRHILHPNFLALTEETELSDQSRWMKVEPADVTAQCIGLVNNNYAGGVPRPVEVKPPQLHGAMVPIEEIPTESLLGREYPEDLDTENARNGYEVKGLFQRGDTQTPPSRDPKSPDSPTIPAAVTSREEAHLQDMLNLQEQLHTSLHESMRLDSTQTPPPSGSLPPPPGPPPGYPGSVSSSPRLESYVNQLNQSNMPRSPALRPSPNDTQGTIAYLQREVMLLKNDLNFERYLKQQHLSHIGHLQRKHIKESTAEAETQNLINTNKTLKAKLEEAKKVYTASRQEALKQKNQAKKWEAELSQKIRTLREEQKAWRQEEEQTKKELQSAQEEAEQLRKMLSESEAECLRHHQKLQSLQSEMEEVNKLRAFVDHLSSKLTEYESRSEEFELQRHNEEAAISQAEQMRIRLQSREQDTQKMRRSYETKIREMESRMQSMSNPMPPTPGPGFQGMIDNALAHANTRYDSLKKAHGHLLRKYTDLEIRYMELQAAQEMDAMGMHGPSGHLQQFQHYEMSSDNESAITTNGGSSRAMSRQQLQHQGMYPSEDESMSPSSSYAESSAGGNSNFGNVGGVRDYHISQSPPPSGYAMNRGYGSQQGQMASPVSPQQQPYGQESVQNMQFPVPGQMRMQQEGFPQQQQPQMMSPHPQQQQPQMMSPHPQQLPHQPQQLQHRPSVPESFLTTNTTGQHSNSTGESSYPGGTSTDDTRSMRTVTSSTSSERKRREKIKPQSEVRVRGRGGVQNVGKKVKEKDKDKDKIGEDGEPVKKKKSRFTPGSGLAGIRGFV